MKVLVVDDHPLIRSAVLELLQKLDANLVSMEASNCAQALEIADVHSDLDLILLDLNLPDQNGIDGLSVMRDQHPAIPVVVLSATKDRGTVVEAIERGAMGFIPKSASSTIMLNALRLVLSGGIYLPLEAVERKDEHSSGGMTVPMQVPRRKPITTTDLGLTDRQSQVLALILQGKPNKVICRELGLAEPTVKIHVTAILKALNVTNRTQAVIAASQMGLKLTG